MAKGSRQNKAIGREHRQIQGDHSQFGQHLWGQLPGAQERGSDLYNRILQGYQGILDDGDGGFGQYENMFNDFARTGGGISEVTPENINRMRGLGVFDEFAKTGGYSDEDIRNIRGQASGANSARFEGLQNRMSQLNKISGGNAGYGASESRLARDASREGNRAVLDAEVGIKDRVNTGRQWGSGMVNKGEVDVRNAMLGADSLRSANKIAGMQGGLGARGMRNARQENALGGMRGLRTDVPGEEFALYNLILGNMGQRGQQAGNNLDRYLNFNPKGGMAGQMLQGGIRGIMKYAPMLFGGGGEQSPTHSPSWEDHPYFQNPWS